jgi:hypothetical protein
MTEESQRPERDSGADRRFERTVRNLLRTPPKPHGKEKMMTNKEPRQRRERPRGKDHD